MEYLSRTNAKIVFTNAIAKLSINDTETLNAAWTHMSEFHRLQNRHTIYNEVTMNFTDDAEQIVGQLLDTLVAHQETDSPVLKVIVGGVCELEFINAHIREIKSPGFGQGTPKNLFFTVVVAYSHVVRTTITK